MFKINLNKKYGIVSYPRSTKVKFEHTLIFESNNLEECFNYDLEDSPDVGHTIIELKGNLISDYYTDEVFATQSVIVEPIKENFTFAVTGTKHGSIIHAESEGEARKIFHEYYNGESIISLYQRSGLWY